jgi:hypothetical protein
VVKREGFMVVDWDKSGGSHVRWGEVVVVGQQESVRVFDPQRV